MISLFFSMHYFPRPVFLTSVILFVVWLLPFDLPPFVVSVCLTVLFPKYLLLIMFDFNSKVLKRRNYFHVRSNSYIIIALYF